MSLERNIITSYYTHANQKEAEKKFYASNLRNAIAKAVYHMVWNEFGARVATVHDGNTGQLFAVYTYKPGEGFKIALEPGTTDIICLTDPRS